MRGLHAQSSRARHDPSPNWSTYKKKMIFVPVFISAGLMPNARSPRQRVLFYGRGVYLRPEPMMQQNRTNYDIQLDKKWQCFQKLNFTNHGVGTAHR